jgi:site-specific recombinase XerD
LIGKRGKQDDNIFNITNPKTGKLITLNGINTVLDNWAKKAGIEKNVSSYVSRHSFGTNIYLYSKDIRSTSMLLGHTSMDNTIKYIRKSEQLENEAIDKLPSFV